MRNFILALFLITIIHVFAYGQSRPTAGRLMGGSTVPTGSCNSSITRTDIYIRSGVPAASSVYLCNAGAWVLFAGGGTPGGSTTQIQFNDASAFGGDAGLTYDKTTDTLTITGLLKTGSTPVTITDAAGKILSAALNTVAVGQGGTGLTTVTSNALIKGNAASAMVVSGVTIDSSNNLAVPGTGGFGDGTIPGEPQMFELSANGSNYISWLAPDAITNTLRLKFPNADPTAGQVLSFGVPSSNISTGAWVTPATADSTTIFSNKSYDTEATGNIFASYYFIEFTAAGSNAGTPAPFLNIPAANGPASGSIAGSNVIHATLDFDAATDESVQGSFWLPADWTGNIDLDVEALANETGTNVARLGIQTICVGAGETYDPAFNTAQTFNWTNTGTNQRVVASQASLTLTTCVAGERFYFKFYRDADGTSGTDSLGVDLRLEALRFKIRRTQ